jgi:hypothetical protein
MQLLPHSSRAAAPVCVAVVLAVGLGACGSTVSTSGFKGEAHAIAQTIANLQSDAQSGEQKKICANDLARTVVDRLGGTKGCEQAIKSQLTEIDNLEVKVLSVAVSPGGTTATARVRSTVSGKLKQTTVSLVKEAGVWKVSALQ